MTTKPTIRRAMLPVLVLALSACQTQPEREVRTAAGRAVPNLGTTSISPARANAPSAADGAIVHKGTGVFIKGQQPGSGAIAPPPVQPSNNTVVLNFEAADLREVVRNILGDILNESYTIDSAVGGQVTIRTTRGIAREALPETLEMLLRMNGATMIREDGIYKIVPQANAARGNVTPQLGNARRPLPPGFSVQIVPLKYVGAPEMLKLLEPFAKDAQAIRIDPTRNLLILSGTEAELRHLIDAAEMFDIDWMAGMSAGIFTLHNADVKSVSQELDKLIGDKAASPLAGVIRIVPIERMNALLVISPNPDYIDQAKKWIERLDSGSGEGTRFYVYNLQNQRAEHVAPLLQQAFTGRATQTTTQAPPTVAPGTPAGSIVSPPAFTPQPILTPNTPQAAAAQSTSSPSATAFATATGRTAGVNGAEGAGIVRNIQVVADKDQNTILIVATPSEYSIIEQALKKLDVPSRQVMIEVTIAQVKLTDQLNFGVDWIFKGANHGSGAGGLFIQNKPFNPGAPAVAGTVPTSPAGAVASGLSVAAQGFSYLINNANFPGGVQAALNLLDQYGNTKVIANPHIAALDNQKATIKAGFRIPVSQQTIVGSTTNAITTTSQYIDTGVLLQVTPHINDGGLVTLDIQAEVSTPGTPAAVGEAPPIDTQSIQTLLSVPSGQTMVMGGLIQDTKGNSNSGLPLVNRIPILGGLFGNQTIMDNRTELVLFVTPKTVNDSGDMTRVIDDLRRRMERLDSVFPPSRGDASK